MCKGGFEETKVSQKFINLRLLQTKTANNSVMHIGTTMIFCGILEGVWPIYNPKKDAVVKVE